MNRDDLQRFKAVAGDISNWSALAQAITDHRQRTAQAADAVVNALRSETLSITIRGRPDWRALPLRTEDGRRIAAVAHHASLPPITPAESEWLAQLTGQVARGLSDARALSGLRRMFSGAEAKQSAEAAGQYLLQFHDWAVAVGIPSFLARVDDRARHTAGVPTNAVLNPQVGLAPRIADLGAPRLLDARIAAELPRSVNTIQRALSEEAAHRKRAHAAGVAVRQSEAQRIISDMPIDRLKEATRERIRTAPLTDAGIRTVQDVFTYGDRLQHLQGIGPTTASRIRGAAQTIWQATYEEMPVRVDIKKPTPQTTELLAALGIWDATRKTKNATSDLARVDGLAQLAARIDRHVTELLVFAVDATHDDFTEAVDAVDKRAVLVGGASRTSAPTDPWQDFMARPADYFAMLQELGFITEDEAAVEGGLPDEVIEAVRRFELETEHLSASLRGYQSFGARFALVQRKVIIGDEMGLGKTVEALAVMAHLRTKGSQHSIVICPAAVVTNWMREVQSKSLLHPHRLGLDPGSWTRCHFGYAASVRVADLAAA